MAKVTEPLQFFLNNVLNNVERMLTDGYLQECDEPYDKDFMKMLLAEARRHFKNLGSDRWTSQDKAIKLLWLLEAFKGSYDDDVFSLVFFVLYSMSLDKVCDHSSEVLSCVAGVLAGREVSPYSYQAYCDMFLSNSIYENFSSLDYEQRFMCCVQIIDEVSIEDIINKRYGRVHKIISLYLGVPYSPLFKGDYSIKNVYEKILCFMGEETYRLFFDDNDRRMLANVGASLSSVSDDDSFRERVSKLEEKYESDRVTLAKMTLREAYKYCALKRNGMSVIRTKEMQKNRFST